MNRAARQHLIRLYTAPTPPTLCVDEQPIALDVGFLVVDVAVPTAGSASSDHEAWWNEHPTPARPWWRSPMRERLFPNGNSSAAGVCVARTPFGDAVVAYESVNGRLYLAPATWSSSGWGDHANYSASVEAGVPVLEGSWRPTLTTYTECPCWRCDARRARRTERLAGYQDPPALRIARGPRRDRGWGVAP
jgi:hypothetical protein